MKLFAKIFQKKDIRESYRWSVIFMNRDFIKYEMLCDNVVRMLGFYMGDFSNNENPIPPWRIFLRYNKTGQTIQLLKDYFPNERYIKEDLYDKIKAIDPGYEVDKFKEVIFINRSTRKLIPISEDYSTHSMEEMINQMAEGTYKEPITFFSVLNSLFTTE